MQFILIAAMSLIIFLSATTLSSSAKVDHSAASADAVIAMQAIFGYDIDGMIGPATLKLIHKQSELGWNLERARSNGYPQNPGQAQA